MYGVAMQDMAGELPTAEEFGVATAEEALHWLALLKQPRQNFSSRYFYGPKYYKRIKQALEETGMIPEWVRNWPEGFDKLLKGEKRPFEGCSTEALLLYRRPQDVIPLTWKSEQRCSGQIATVSPDPDDNKDALRFSAMTSGGIMGIESSGRNTGRYSAGGFMMGLGRVASIGTLFTEEETRAALIEVKEYRDAVQATEIYPTLQN
jgi:hypothetical protein